MKVRLGIVVAVVSVMSIAGCGGDSEKDSSSTNKASSPAASSGGPGLADIETYDPEPLGSICGTMGDGGPPTEVSEEAGMTRTSTTFCSDSTVDGLYAGEFDSEAAADSFLADDIIFEERDVPALSEVEVYGDVRCQALSDDGEATTLCATTSGRFIVVASGRPGATSEDLISTGISPLIEWIESGSESA